MGGALDDMISRLEPRTMSVTSSMAKSRPRRSFRSSSAFPTASCERAALCAALSAVDAVTVFDEDTPRELIARHVEAQVVEAHEAAQPPDVRLLGGGAVVAGAEGAPEPLEEVGKYIEIRMRQPDGSWRLAVDIFNSDK